MNTDIILYVKSIPLDLKNVVSRKHSRVM